MKLKSLCFAAATALATVVAFSAQAETWSVNSDQSKLGFEVKQGDGSLTGTFTEWDADIDFDPENPGAAQISAEIQPASASTGNAQFDGTLPGKDWFNVSSFPKASFAASGAEHLEGNSYRADGTLTIKDVSQPVSLEFTLDIDGDTAHVAGTAKINRLDYQMGSSVGTDTVGDAVVVTLDMTATK